MEKRSPKFRTLPPHINVDMLSAVDGSEAIGYVSSRVRLPDNFD